MNRTLDFNDTNFTSFILEEINENELINTTTTKITITSTTNTVFRVSNSTKIFPFSRLSFSPTTTSSLSNQFFIFNTAFNRNMRAGELAILSLTLPLYAIVFILFIELNISRISTNTAISGGGSRSRSQRRRQRLRSLIWTSNYVLVDFLNLLYELAYLIIHLSGTLSLKSFIGRFYCQLQIYLPLYLTVLMAYSLAAISIYRRRHFVSLNNTIVKSTKRSLLTMIALWIMPIITSIIPAFLLVYFKILKIIQHETTNQCQISYTYKSNAEAIYVFYRLMNIFLLPISISLVCYIAIYVDSIRMQRRFSQTFRRHVHIRKNLIIQILFLFLNFTVFWLPAELIMFYTKNLDIKDAAQVTKSFNILFDPLIIIVFDTRFSSAARQLLSTWPFNQFMHCFNNDRHTDSSIITPTIITRRSQPSRQTTNQPMTTTSTWNIISNDGITVLESVSNHSLRNSSRRLTSSFKQRRPRTKRTRARRTRSKIVENHV